MVEVLFGESEAGSMKAAKSTVIAGVTNGPVSVWAAGKREFHGKKEFSGWIPGTAAEVICLGFMLDIGDIKEPVDSFYRKNLIYSLYAAGRWEENAGADEELRRVAEIYVGETVRLKDYLKEGETIRIWYSDAPYSRCGFYSLCGMLQEYENDVRVVKMPEYRCRADSVVSYSNWGEVAAEEFGAFLAYEKALSRQEVRMYALLWSNLVEENSPLRVVVNGRLVGVPEDFYDFLIWKKLTREPVMEAKLIGDILGNYRMGIGDWWYARRIEHFMKQGRIKVTKESENKYARMICLA